MKTALKQFDYSNISKNSSEISKALEAEILNILSFQDTFDRIEAALDGFEKSLQVALSKNEFIDVKLAREVYITAVALFRICEKDPWQKFIPFALASISYFLNPLDGEDDFETIDGFEDDKMVLVHLIQTYQLQDAIEAEVKELKKKEGAKK